MRAFWVTSLVLVACSQTSSANTADAGDICNPPLSPIERARLCRLPAIPATGLCEPTVGRGLGTYVLCAVAPDGTMFVLGTSSDAELRAPGWTFGPYDWVGSIYKLPRLSQEDERVCQKIAFVPTPATIPACSDVDASVDGPAD